MKKARKSLQELILNRLARRRASKQDHLIEDIEVLLNKYEKNERRVKPKYVINRAIKKMIENEMLEHHETAQSSFLSLTSSGRQKLRHIKLNAENHLVSTTWDGYWRIIIVDIPESQKKDQDSIRYILKKAQFIQIKSSVWITPFPMEHIMINIKKDMGLEEEVLVLVTNKLDPTTEELLIRKFAETQQEER
jgi:DNA-binding transcriptional regulator PaaX